MANNLTVGITADVAGLTAKLAIAKADVQATSKTLNELARQSTAAGVASKELEADILAAGGAAAKAAAEFARLAKEKKSMLAGGGGHGHEESSSMFAGIKEGLASITEGKAAIMEFGEAMIAAFALEKIMEWGKELGEAAEKTKHLAETFGMSIPQIQGLQAAASATGIPIETLTKAMGIFDKNMINAAGGTGTAVQAFKAIGLSAADGKSQMDMLLATADKFQHMEDGPKKVALAMELFGKSGKDMVPFLNMGAEGIEHLDQASQKYAAGALIATAANQQLREWLEQVNEKGVALAETNNETTVAMQGVTNVMTDAFAPILAEATQGINALIEGFIQSYREGGAVAVVMETISGGISVLETIVQSLWQIWEEVWGAVQEVITSVVNAISEGFGQKVPSSLDVATAYYNIFKDVVVVAKDVILIAIDTIVGAVENLVGKLKLLGTVTKDVLTFNWGAIAGDWRAGMSDLDKIVEDTAKKIKAHASEMAAALAAAAQGKAVGGGHSGVPEAKGAKDFDPDIAKQPKQKAPNADKSRMSGWEAVLEQQKVDFKMLQDAQNGHEQWSLQKDVDYWKALISQTEVGTKDRLEVDKKYLAARDALTNQQISNIEVAAKKELDAAGQDSAKRIAILQNEAKQIAALPGDNAKAIEEIQHQITEATQQGAQRQIAIFKKQQEDAKRIRDDDAKAQEALIKDRGDSTMFGGVAAARDEGALKLKGIYDEIAARKELHAEMVANHQDDAAFASDQAALDAKVRQQQIANILAVQQAYHSYIDGTVSAAVSGFDGLISGQKTWAQVGAGIYQSMAHTFEQQLEKMISQWIVKHIFMTAVHRTQLAAQTGQQVAAQAGQTAAIAAGTGAQVAVTATGAAAKAKIVGMSNMKEITSHAAAAAAGAYNALAAIPVVGPVLGAAAAAVTFAAVEGYGMMASFDKGTNMLPSDMIAQVHAGERIVPAADNKAIITALNGGGPNIANDNSRGGDTHVHNTYAPTINGQLPFADQLDAHETNVIGMLNRAARNGSFKYR